MARRCVENTKSGRRCRAPPMKGGDTCMFHVRRVSKIPFRRRKRKGRK